MANERPKWKSINMGDKLPCQSFLRKKNGEILKLSTIGGVKVGQDCYYLPVDEVINVINGYPVEESEDEKIRKEIIDIIDSYDVYHLKAAGLPSRIPEYIAWLEKQGEQKTAEWSKEDEEHIMAIDLAVNRCTGKWHCCGEKCPISEHSPWLKSLKDRVQSHLKHELSEKDYNEIETIACHLDNTDNEGMAEVLRNIRDKYMSLRPHWKPSDEQMKTLQYLCETSAHPNEKVIPTLESLYQELKKLREE